jgi:glucan phosphoethanolaminetransferase (alkaline phosphatase superfamily)
MNVTLLKWLSVAFSAMLLSSLVSMMAAFVGSEGADLRDLVILQTILIPFAVSVVIWIFAALIRRHGYKAALRQFWNSLPGWLLFAVFAANSLVMIAELSFILIQHHTGDLRPWQEHVPAATALFSSIALASCYVAFRLSDPGVKTPSSEQ